MEKNKKEILERVLLLMKYDNRHTLSENFEKIIISEQPSPKESKKIMQDMGYSETPPARGVGVAPILKSGGYPKLTTSNSSYASPVMWEGVNLGYEQTIKSFSCVLKDLTMRELVNLFKKMTPSSGVITPDFIGYKMYNNPTIASTILENEIYLRRLNNKDSFEKIKSPIKEILRPDFFDEKYRNIVNDIGNNIGKTPQIPESTLLRNEFASSFTNRSASSICSEGIFPKSEGPRTKTKYEIQQSEKKIKSKVDSLKNRKEAWEFLSNKLLTNQGYRSSDTKASNSIKDSSFKFYSEFKATDKGPSQGPARIDKTWESFFGMTPEEFYVNLEKSPVEQRAALTTLYNQKKIDENITKSLFGEGTNIFIYALDAGLSQQEANLFLNKFGTPNEKSEIELMQIIGEKESETEDKEYVKELESKQSDIASNPILLKVFSKQIIDDSLKDENCKSQYLKFFQGIIDGSVRNNNNDVVGKAYYDKNKKLYYAKWNEITPPCTNEWWDKYGWKIQVGAAVVAGILLPGYSWGLVFQVLIDAGLNVYSLKQAEKSQDKDRINLESMYLFLPLLMATRPVRVALEELKFTKKTIDSLTNKLKSITSNTTPAQRDFILQNLTNEEKRALTMMGTNSKVRDVVKNTTKQTLDDLKKSAKSANVSALRKYSEPIVNLLVYGVPMVGYIAYQIANLDKITQEKLGRPLNKEEKEIWSLALSLLSEDDAKKLISYVNTLSPERLEKGMNDGTEYGRQLKKDVEAQGLTPENTKSLTENMINIIEYWLKNIPDSPTGESDFPVDIEFLDAPNDTIKVPEEPPK